MTQARCLGVSDGGPGGAEHLPSGIFTPAFPT